jgi:hypothetical protein
MFSVTDINEANVTVSVHKLSIYNILQINGIKMFDNIVIRDTSVLEIVEIDSKMAYLTSFTEAEIFFESGRNMMGNGRKMFYLLPEELWSCPMSYVISRKNPSHELWQDIVRRTYEADLHHYWKILQNGNDNMRKSIEVSGENEEDIVKMVHLKSFFLIILILYILSIVVLVLEIKWISIRGFLRRYILKHKVMDKTKTKCRIDTGKLNKIEDVFGSPIHFDDIDLYDLEEVIE